MQCDSSSHTPIYETLISMHYQMTLTQLNFSWFYETAMTIRLAFLRLHISFPFISPILRCLPSLFFLYLSKSCLYVCLSFSFFLSPFKIHLCLYAWRSGNNSHDSAIFFHSVPRIKFRPPRPTVRAFSSWATSSVPLKQILILLHQPLSYVSFKETSFTAFPKGLACDTW